MKKLILSIVCAVVMIFGHSCKGKGKIANTETADVQLEFSTIEINASIGYPIDIINQNDTLYINDLLCDTMAVRINAKTDELIDKFAVIGNGPGEVLKPIELRPTSDSIYVLSRPNQTLYSGNKTGKVTLKKRLQMPSTISRLFFLNDNNAIASVMSYSGTPKEYKDSRFILYDKNFNIKYAFGSFPKQTNKEQSLNSEALSNLHQTNCILCPSPNKFIAITQYGMSVYTKGKSGKYELSFDKALINYDFTVNEGNSMISTQVRTAPESDGGIAHAVMFGDKILLAQFNKRDQEDNSVYFRILNQEGETLKVLHPTIDVMIPFVLSSNNEIIAFHEDESGINLIKSMPID
jgi:hypothetical protein